MITQTAMLGLLSSCTKVVVGISANLQGSHVTVMLGMQTTARGVPQVALTSLWMRATTSGWLVRQYTVQVSTAAVVS